MNRQEAKQLAETVTAEQLKQMLVNARNGITNWEKVSSVNMGLTKGAAFNIFSKCTIDDPKRNQLAVVNMLREFGEWLPDYNPAPKKEKPKAHFVKHEEPSDLDDIFG